MRQRLLQALIWMHKDLYSARWLAAVVFIVTLISPFAAEPQLFSSNSFRSPALSAAGGLLITVMLLGWWALTERLIHTDPVPGDRELWFTLPISRGLLATSKLALLVLLILVPWTLGDLALVAYAHANLASMVAGLMPRAIFFFTVLILPAALISALTRNLSQFFVAIIAAALMVYTAVFVAASFSPRFSPLQISSDVPWIPIWTLVLFGLAIGVGVIYWLYGKRRFVAGRFAAIAIVGIFVSGPPWIPSETQWRWHRRWQADATLDKQIGFTFDEAALLVPADPGPSTDPRRRVPIHFDHLGLPVPLVISGVPEEIFVIPRRGEFVIRAVDGETLAKGEIPGFAGSPSPTRATVAQLQSAAGNNSVPDRVRIEMSINAEAFRGEPHVVELKEGWNRLETFGNCWFSGGEVRFCASTGPRFPFTRIETTHPRFQTPFFGSLDFETAPIAIPGWSPIEITAFSPVVSYAPQSELRYWTWKYQGPVEVKIVIPNYRISDYTSPPDLNFIRFSGKARF